MDPIPISHLPIVSVDLETGGLTPGKHTPLSIGAVKLDADHSVINCDNSFYIQLEWDTMVVTQQAMRVNGLDIANPPGSGGLFDDCSLPGPQGLRWFSDWIYNNRDIYALGANVGSFDLSMLKSIWQGPGATKWPFHYRSIDLNSLFFALSSLQNIPFDIIKKEITKKVWSDVKELHLSTMSVMPLSTKNEELEHHALYDAWSNVFAWKECIRRFETDVSRKN